MFRRQLVSLILIWVLCACGFYFVLHKGVPDAEISYQLLMDLSDQVKVEESKQHKQPVQQTRYEVSKQMLYTKDNKRLQSRLSSEKSELVFNQQAGRGGLIEHFTGMTCAFQEMPRPEGDRHHFRQLKARKAIYFYKGGLLEAEDVAVADYLIPGEQWPESFDQFPPFLQGKAKRVDLSLFNETDMNGQGLQANVGEEEK